MYKQSMGTSSEAVESSSTGQTSVADTGQEREPAHLDVAVGKLLEGEFKVVNLAQLKAKMKV